MVKTRLKLSPEWAGTRSKRFPDNVTRLGRIRADEALDRVLASARKGPDPNVLGPKNCNVRLQVSLRDCLLGLRPNETESFHGFDDQALQLATAKAEQRLKRITGDLKSINDPLYTFDGGVVDFVVKEELIEEEPVPDPPVRQKRKGRQSQQQALTPNTPSSKKSQTRPEKDVTSSAKSTETQKKPAKGQKSKTPEKTSVKTPTTSSAKEKQSRKRKSEIVDSPRAATPQARETRKEKPKEAPTRSGDKKRSLDRGTPNKKAKISKKDEKSDEEEEEDSEDEDEEEESEEDEDEEDEDEDNAEKPEPVAAPAGQKQLIRPSKLGGFGSFGGGSFGSGLTFGASSRTSLSSEPQPASATPSPSSSTSRLFGSSPSELIVEGKRQWKPSAKVQEKINDETNPSNSMIKKSITQYADAVAKSSTISKDDHEGEKMQQKIQRILASQWDSRLRKVENKFVKSGSRVPTDEEPGQLQQKKPLLRESKLELNKNLLERMRKPSQQVQFYEAIQRSMQCADKTPPKLLNSSANINPAGTALVEEQTPKPKIEGGSTEKIKASNRMPGNIVCGICGAVRYYAFILQAKKFGTFSCEPCRKFISRTIKNVRTDKSASEDSFHCVSGTGSCVVPPVIRTTNTGNAPKKAKSADGSPAEVRCQACWLKLCLIGYNLENELYDKLRACLPKVSRDQLPEGSKRSNDLLPHRGEILEFNRQVPLSRPLFDGFGAAGTSKGDGGKTGGVSDPKKGGKPSANHIVHERLPNGWTKKAVKRLTGVQKGKWDMYLITPDQKILKSPGDLKLYIAKSGAVIDSNIVNFALPKKTAKVDKALQKKVIEVKKEPMDDLEDESEPKKKAASSPMAKKPKQLDVNFPRSSRRRETKVPLKYVKDLGAIGKEAKKAPKVQSPNVPSAKAADTRDSESEEDVEIDDEDDEDYQDDEDLEEATNEEKRVPPILAKKTSIQDIKTIGVGTFSIDKDTVRALPTTPGGSLADLRFKKCKRTVACKKCANCLMSDCMQCNYCLDRKKHGGKGNLKKICIRRRCLDPQMPGLPAMSTFRKSNIGDVKRGYVRIATAVATKSAPPPPAEEAYNDEDVPVEDLEQKQEEPELMETEPMDEDEYIMQDQSYADDGGELLAPGEDDIAASPEFAEPETPTPKHSRPQTPVLQQEVGDSPNKWGNAKPPLSYAGLIATVLDHLPEKRATLADLYRHVMRIFPYYAVDDGKNQWQNSIRHNLSMHKEFVRIEKPGKGGYWSLAPGITKDSFKLKGQAKEDFGTPRSKGQEVKLLPNTASPGQIPSASIPSASMLQLEALSNAAPSSIHLPPSVRARPKSPQRTSTAVRRQSLEEFLEFGLGKSPNKQVTVLSATDDNKQRRDIVPIPPPSPKSRIKTESTRHVAKPTQSTNGKFTGSIDYWEQYDPETAALSGQSVITSDDLPGVDVLCFLCGSAGQEEMLYCTTCCEPFHPFCVDQDELPQSAETEKQWVCKRCAVCQVCGSAEGTKLRCSECAKASHKDCLQESQRRLANGSPEGSWVCFQCLRCNSCGKADVSHYFEGSPLCATCCLQKKQGSYCPLCEGCYDDNDYETRMMECAKCGGWVHAKCEGVDAEKYQILSYLPDTVEYVCKCSRPMPRKQPSPSQQNGSHCPPQLGLVGQNVVTPVASHRDSPSHNSLEKELHTFNPFPSSSIPNVPSPTPEMFQQIAETKVVESGEFVQIPIEGGDDIADDDDDDGSSNNPGNDDSENQQQQTPELKLKAEDP